MVLTFFYQLKYLAIKQDQKYKSGIELFGSRTLTENNISRIKRRRAKHYYKERILNQVQIGLITKGVPHTEINFLLPEGVIFTPYLESELVKRDIDFVWE